MKASRFFSGSGRASPVAHLRAIFHLALVILTAAGLASCGDSSPRQASSPPFRIAGAFWPGTYWIDVANRKGWFREAGLDATVFDTNPDYLGSFQKLVDGELDCHGLPIFDFVRLKAEGNEIVGVLVTDFTRGAEAVVVRPGINSIQDLRGKRIGVTLNTYGEHVLNVMAERGSLDLEEVQLVNMVAERAHEEFIAGKVDAVFTWAPLIDLALKGVPQSKVLFSSADTPGISGGIQCFSKKFVKTRPDDVRKVLQVWKRGSEFIRDHPEEAYRIVAEANKVSLEDVHELVRLDRVLNIHDNEVAFSYSSGFDSIHGNVRRINDFLIKKKMTTRELDTGEILDGSFVRELGSEE